MAKPADYPKPITTGWLRVLIFTGTYLATMVAVNFIIQSLTRNISGINPAGYALLTFLVLGAFSFLLVKVFCKALDKRPFLELGWQDEDRLRNTLTGSALAMAILGTGTIILVANNNLKWMDVTANGPALALSFALMLIVSFTEELVFRGYILRNLIDSFPPAFSLAISALVFALFHGANPGSNWLALANVFLAGILLGLNYLFTGSLWFGIGLHFWWNFLQGPILGYSVSGLGLPSLLNTYLDGPPFLTGGSFGFEGSILNTVLDLLSIGILAFIYSRLFEKDIQLLFRKRQENKD
ncbi:CPBP family intramembrane metalloprotease [Flavihumibacter rivuli]|uniref:CPBP family intramembrane glutamic endopeptidase n=1 Tax=Flavihumibacter rivuli TaxID=2838156 RepID=UPI001BDE7F80|nr:type II CAAX endopeptidase family protein [Flavihumibacter rivuli]ULQ56696.1 CPBP family intramembrane metalloprotease [Flavihumibacter rivuli]